VKKLLDILTKCKCELGDAKFNEALKHVAKNFIGDQSKLKDFAEALENVPNANEEFEKYFKRLKSFVNDENDRRQGVGSELTEEAIEHARTAIEAHETIAKTTSAIGGVANVIKAFENLSSDNPIENIEGIANIISAAATLADLIGYKNPLISKFIDQYAKAVSGMGKNMKGLQDRNADTAIASIDTIDNPTINCKDLGNVLLEPDKFFRELKAILSK
jgi:hypothetical protein